MKFARTAISLLVLAAIASTAAAEPAKTREQVKAELREAIRTGNVFATGDSGLKLNEMYPQRYPQTTVGETKTREQVKAELAEAMRSGDVIVAGEGGLTLREEFPGRYPAVAVVTGRTREEVKAETLEAIRSGDMYAAGEGEMKLNQEFPQRYVKERAVYRAQAKATTPAGSTTAR